MKINHQTWMSLSENIEIDTLTENGAYWHIRAQTPYQ